MKPTKPIVTIESVKEIIKPQVEMVQKWEKGLSNLREALRKYEDEYDVAQQRLTEIIGKTQEAIADGRKVRIIEEDVTLIKSNRDILGDIINEIRVQSIPSAEENLRLAQSGLKDAILTNSEELRMEYAKRITEKFGEISQIWNEFTNFFNELRKDLAVQPMSFEIDKIRTLPRFDIPKELRCYIGNLQF